MKTVEMKRELERSEIFVEKTFQIKANHKAFKILSDGLYSDKIKAIIRELSCNAYDAHVDAGTQDIPFDIFLPTHFDPTFYIRDYGTGLSKKDVENVYTTYFESTKTETNDVIGCLGLGSKSPFSYVQMFTITSFFNGMQFVYSAFLNESGTPSIVLINESETEEKNGLKVQFAVKKEDFSEFKYKTEEVFRYFNSIPNFIGCTPHIKKREYAVKNGVWGLSSDRTGKAIAVMGNVAYPVSLDRIDFSKEEEAILQRFPVDLFFKIGDLEVSASREGLSYDKRTTEAIRNRVQEIINHEKERIEKDLEKQKCYWDAIVWLSDQKTTNKIVDLLFYNSKLKYKDRELISYIEINNDEYMKIDSEYSLSCISYVNKYRRKTYSYEKSLGKITIASRVHVTSNCVLFVNDCKNRHVLRVQQYLIKNKGISTAYLLKTNNASLIKKFMEDLGITEIKNLSDIEPVSLKKEKDTSISGNFVKMKWVTYDYKESSQYWEEIPEGEDFDIEKGGFYVPVNRWKTVHNGIEDFPRDSLFVMNELYKKICPNNIHNVYGIKKVKVSIVEGRDNWINWIDFVQEIIRQYALTDKVHKKLEVLCGNSGINYGHIGRMFNAIKCLYEINNINDSKKVIGSEWMEKCSCNLFKDLGEKHDQLYSGSTDISDSLTKFIYDYIQKGKSTLTSDEIKKIQNYRDHHKELIKKVEVKYPIIRECYSIMGDPAGLLVILDYINAINQYKL